MSADQSTLNTMQASLNVRIARLFVDSYKLSVTQMRIAAAIAADEPDAAEQVQTLMSMNEDYSRKLDALLDAIDAHLTVIKDDHA